MKNAVVLLVPAAVLRGRVTDEDGDPAQARMQVVPLATRGPYSGLIRSLSFSGTNGTTNDLGEFRISGVPPGRYYLEANPEMGLWNAVFPVGKAQQSAYMPVFYPSALTRDAAAVLDLHGGEEVVANIVLQRAVVYPVSGILINGKNEPISNGTVSARQGTTQFGAAWVHDGKFELRLPPGRYTLSGFKQASDPDDDEGPTQVDKRIDVPEGGLRNLELVIGSENGQSALVSGRVRAETGASLPKDNTFYVGLQPLGTWMDQREDDDNTSRSQNGMRAAQTKPDGTFELKNVAAGTYELTISSGNPGLEDWYTKAVLVGTGDVLNSGVPVSNADLQLEVVLSAKGGSVEGTAKDREQQPAVNARVVLIPDAARAKRQELYSTTSTDEVGHFLNRGIEPGSYTAYAFDDDHAGVWLSPETMKQYKDDGVPISVNAADKSHAELHLAINHQQQETQ